jgi:hypothetical protein
VFYLIIVKAESRMHFMLNERVTENIVRNLLRQKGYYDDANIIIEEQKVAKPKNR